MTSPDAQAGIAELIERLPELPQPACAFADHSFPAFTAKQMRDYALAALSAQPQATGSPPPSPALDEAVERARSVLRQAELELARYSPNSLAREAVADTINSGILSAAFPASGAGVPDGWRDMDSAPKDGTTVLLYAEAWDMTWGAVQTGRFEGGRWVTGEGEVEENEPGFDPDEEVGDDFDLDDDTNLGPTHWLPLPSPPHPDPRRKP